MSARLRRVGVTGRLRRVVTRVFEVNAAPAAGEAQMAGFAVDGLDLDLDRDEDGQVQPTSLLGEAVARFGPIVVVVVVAAGLIWFGLAAHGWL
ncbi:hypothetical protein ABZ671_00440 [Micromonospora sp. NPDC006766]|uniref:hypothetical protein n=1 Tax=Micromonospora sp. NPDC006766 TaxID=3154778 RepID=UPI00340AB593